MEQTTPLNVLRHQSLPLIEENPSSCCESGSQQKEWIGKVDLICRVALASFALWIAPLQLAVSLTLGLSVGAGYAFMRNWQHQSLLPAGQGKPVCAQGYMDFLSGMRFPPIIGSAVTTAFIAAHMRHDPNFYVPFCGFFIGFWLGKEIAMATIDLSARHCSSYPPLKSNDKCRLV